ncbi:MAG TPA: sialidase family protein [Vicinamibacterales bacterium]|nr:sialidase family protein [Vicinamibacterales bacterium]
MRFISGCAALAGAVILATTPAIAQTNSADKPTWWAKYQFLAANGPDNCTGQAAIAVGTNVDVSNECGPQSETFVTINPSQPKMLAGGSNEIFRLPMRGYFSTDAGNTWGGVDLPLPAAKGNGFVFGSDPSLAFDTRGNVFYSYINVYVGHGNGINGTSMGVSRSTDGGRTYSQFTEFSVSGGSDHFNDKPMIAVDTNLASPFRDSVYVAWDAASGGSSGGGVRFARSTDHGATFTVTRIDNPSGPGRVIAAQPFVGPNGEVYVAWNDYAANTITVNRSLDGGVTWGQPVVISSKVLSFDIAIPAESFRGALVYPSCAADRSSGAHRGRLYCSWMDLNAAGNTDIRVSVSDDGGSSWSPAAPATDAISGVDRFNHWLAVDPVTGDVNLSFYDTRNDTTGSRYMTDIYFSQSRTGAASWLPNIRVTDVSSNEHDCNGVFPCSAIDYGNQTGDYAGLASFGGVSYPIWTDSRNQLHALPGCRTGLAMEEVFAAAVSSKR